MAQDIVIRAQGLGKRYMIGHQAERERYVALRDVIASGARRLAGAARDAMAGRPMGEDQKLEEFWALKDVNFEIARGEVVGIIGRNGAGKSTLLKILSRITEPTTGRVEIRGRVASLLEVGTGFHPELSGRENIFLNGAILGMSRAEIKRKFDEIVAFAEVEKFLDTPVKRYSSGMYVRLAFAVAAHLEPEILVVDEVLAVGDAEFQRKCLGKMQDVAAHGRTVLFVSHQLGMVAKLCTRGLVMTRGQITFGGASSDAIAHYVAQGRLKPQRGSVAAPTGPSQTVITGFQALARDGNPTEEFSWQDPIRVQVEVSLRHRQRGVMLGVAIVNRHASRVTTWHVSLDSHLAPDATEGVLQLEIPSRIIAPGIYSFTVALFKPGTVIYHQLENEWPIVIVDSGSAMAEYGDVDYGCVIIPAEWQAVDKCAHKNHPVSAEKSL